MDPITELRNMWQFAATWKVLKLLSHPLSFSMPGPALLEQALLQPLENLSLIANLHGRLLGLSAGASAAKKWLQTTARFVRNRPDDFSHLLARHTDEENQHPKLADNEQAVNETITFPTSEDSYADLSVPSRLLFLHNISEIVLSEHDTLLSAGNILELQLEELRKDPIGKDAAGNLYWYFGDLERLYREPPKRVQKTKHEIAQEQRDQQKQKAAQKARLAKEAKRLEAQSKKEEQRQRREERKRKSMEKWAPRVAATRTTRASRRAEKTVVSATASAASDQQSEEGGGTRTPRGGRSRLKNSSTNSNNSNDELNTDEGVKNLSGRRRKASPQDAKTVATPPKTAKRPRKNGPEFEDISLRQCNGWEVLTTNAESLEALLERFGPPANAPNASERQLLKYIHAEILPPIQECEQKIRRERERREKTEFLLSNQKRSSRVAALELKREEQARRLAAQEEEERLEDEKKDKHTMEVQKKLQALEHEQSRDIRSTRRQFNLDNEIERDERVQKVRNAFKAKVVTPTRPRRQSRRTRRFDDSETASPRGSLSPTAEDKSKTDDQTYMPSPDGMENAAAGDSDEGSHSPDSIDDMEVEAEEITQACKEELKSSETEHVKESWRKAFSSGITENFVDQAFTWLDNSDDGLPIRVLDKFFFAEKSDFSDAPLENCDSEGTQTVGIGLLVPPVLSNADPVRIEISEIEDWVIEYGERPKLWVKTVSAWYELRGPALEYSNAFVTTRRKYELCIRISILGDLMRASQLTYDEVIDLMSLTYEDMLAYKEEDILAEKRFIISQMEPLGIRSLMQSGFIRELRKLIRTEDRKSEAQTATPERTGRSRDPVVDSHSSADSPDAMVTTAKSESTIGEVRKGSIRKRDVVPRAVSNVISSMLKEATKSAMPIRKRKRSLGLEESNAVAEKGESCGMAGKETNLETADKPLASEDNAGAGNETPGEAGRNEHSGMNGHSAKRKADEGSASGKQEVLGQTRILKRPRLAECNGQGSKAVDSDEKSVSDSDEVGKLERATSPQTTCLVQGNVGSECVTVLRKVGNEHVAPKVESAVELKMKANSKIETVKSEKCNSNEVSKSSQENGRHVIEETAQSPISDEKTEQSRSVVES